MDAGERRGLDDARKLLSSGKLREALARLLHLTEKYPEDVEVREGIAEVLVAQGAAHAEHGEFVRAASELERSVRYSDNPEAHINLGRIHQVQGRFDDAFAEYTRALDLNEDLVATHEALGDYFLEVQDFDQAAMAFERALAKGSTNRSVHLGLWEAYVGLGKTDRAHETILDAAKQWPNDDHVLGTVGLSWAVAQNDYDSAEEWWKKAVAVNPRNLPSLFNLSGLAALRGRRAEALEYMRQCVAVDRARTMEMWKEDARAPRRKFAAYVGDEDFLDILSSPPKTQ